MAFDGCRFAGQYIPLINVVYILAVGIQKIVRVLLSFIDLGCL